jgi:hypothetical protein
LTTIGSAETTTLKAPHRHLAVLGIFVVSSDWSDPVSTRAWARKKTSNSRFPYWLTIRCTKVRTHEYLWVHGLVSDRNRPLVNLSAM